MIYQRIKAIIILIIILILFSAFSRLNIKLQKHKTLLFASFLSPLAPAEKKSEVFGFAPYWNIDKMDNIKFDVLTTLAYFDLPVEGSGDIDTNSPGYQTFLGDDASNLFAKAKRNKTKVVVTLTQMNNFDIEQLMDDREAQAKLADNVITLVESKNLNGVNIDFEYTGNPGEYYRQRFTEFVSSFTKKMHERIPDSKVTVSVYASAVKDPQIYDIRSLSEKSDGIFMMAYDFAVANSDNAIPTSPLYGHKEGEYWYDISTAVDDFLKEMSSNKLILGLPWYGYSYPVSDPQVNAPTQGYSYYYWYGGRRYLGYYKAPGFAQTYSDASEISPISSGWDNLGKVGWKAYMQNGIIRMLFVEDKKSLKIKYDFAKDKNLLGVGMWALGNDYGKNELWDLLSKEFGKS